MEDLTEQILRRLKFDNYTIDNVVELIRYHDATFNVGGKYVKRWLNKIGKEQFKRLLELRKADIKAQLKVQIILTLAKHKYPPATRDDVFKAIIEQAENFKKNN